MTTSASVEDRLTTVEGAVQDLRVEQQETSARLAAVEGAVQDVQAEQRQTNARLTAVEGRLDAVETNLSELRADVRLIHVRLDTMQTEWNFAPPGAAWYNWGRKAARNSRAGSAEPRPDTG